MRVNHEYKSTSVNLTPKQKKFAEEHAINISKLTRSRLNELMKKMNDSSNRQVDESNIGTQKEDSN